jgi:serine/threonine protein kinase
MKCRKCFTENAGDSQFCSKCGTRLYPTSESLTATQTFYAPSFELAIGSLFAGRYQIIEELGRGGMGRVYKVLDREINEKIALKILKPEISADEKTIERFRNELKFARKISHQNVCRMYDLAKEGGVYYITMEYVSGEDLKSTLERVGQISVGKTLKIAKQICKGLVEAHRLGVTHRDLKPHNIMIDREGEVRIMDFGIARSITTTGITESGVMIGTPEYMSPEQALGESIDHRSDIYSFGVILFELLTGMVPFQGDTAVSVALKQKTEIPSEPKSFNPQIPGDLNALILKCLEKDRKKRFQSADEILQEIFKIEKTVPTTEKMVSEKASSGEVRPKRRLGRFLVPAAALLGIALVAGWWFFLHKEPEPSAKLPPPPPPKVDNAFLNISSVPSGVKIYLDEQEKGVTPGKYELSPGTYKIRLNAPHYQEKAEILKLDAGGNVSKDYTLDPLYMLEITTNPLGASVWIDGILQGKTPTTLEWPKDTCRLRIERGGEWVAQDETLRLVAGKTNVVNRILQRVMLKLSVATDPPGALVSVGNEQLGISPIEKMLPAGTYTIKLEKEGFKTKIETLTLRSSAEKLYPLARLEEGSVQFSAYPFADISVDGKFIVKVPPLKSFKFLEGKHAVTFNSPSLNKQYNVEVEIKAGRSVHVHMNMQTGESKITEEKI